jgi:hypothetical protein
MIDPELENFFEKRSERALGGSWKSLPLDQREKMISDFVEKNSDNMGGVRETVKDIRDQNRDSVLFIYGLLLGVLGGMIAVIIQSFLSKYGVVYYVIVFLLAIIICLSFVRFVRTEKRITIRSNQAVREFIKAARKEIAKNKK